MSSGGGTPKATAEEKKLGQLATEGYAQADELNGGKYYLLNEAAKTDRSGKYAAQSNASAAAIIDKSAVNPMITNPTELRTLTGGEVAAEAQHTSEAQNAGFSLANAGLGTKTLTEKAIYQQGVEQMQVDAANKAAADAKAAFLPSVLGTAVGAYGTSEYGQEQLKELWEKFSVPSTPTPGNGAAPSAAFTGSASLYRK